MTTGKNKGSQWERDIAKYLTHWLTEQNLEYYFWRTPASGGMGTILPENTQLHGDIIPLKEEANILCDKFCIELKTGYKEASLDKHLKTNKTDPIKSFWSQCISSANASYKNPLLIYKKKNQNPWAGISHNIFHKLESKFTGYKFIHLRWGIELSDCYLFDMNTFFSIVTPEVIKEI